MGRNRVPNARQLIAPASINWGMRQRKHKVHSINTIGDWSCYTYPPVSLIRNWGRFKVVALQSPLWVHLTIGTSILFHSIDTPFVSQSINTLNLSIPLGYSNHMMNALIRNACV